MGVEPNSIEGQLAEGKLHADHERAKRDLSQETIQRNSESAQDKANEASRKAAEEIGRNAVIVP